MSASNVPSSSAAAQAAARAGTIHGDDRRATNGARHDGGLRQLAIDARIGLLVLSEARYRAAKRLFGVPREDSRLVTLIVLGTLANAGATKAGRLVRVPRRPSLMDAFLGAVALRAAVGEIAGATSSDSPAFGTIVTVAVVAAAPRSVLRPPVRAAKAVSRSARDGFHHRYGHLVYPRGNTASAALGRAAIRLRRGSAEVNRRLAARRD